ncbi:MAG: hypothetical protein KDA85_05555 [Planctomycetaceae bacterium]|nr:hypothetical protein [Planctomycetaceae bacterium]
MKTSSRILVRLAAVAGVFAFAGVLHAQTTDTQRFTVTVPSSLSITAPADRTLTHDTTNNSQVFTPGGDTANHWAVLCNSSAGASVNITATSPFTHTSDSTYKRDAALNLAVSSSDNTGGGSSIWAVTQSTASTDYANAVNTASVTASSAQPGKATLALTVTFVTNTYSTLLQGDYVVDVVGTIAAN